MAGASQPPEIGHLVFLHASKRSSFSVIDCTPTLFHLSRSRLFDLQTKSPPNDWTRESACFLPKTA
jgi:hypothetical protein